MANRFVRSSAYRHVYGSAAKKEGCYQGIRPECKGESGYVAASPDFFAFPAQGGGGPVMVLQHDTPSRLGASAKKLSVHKGTVVDLEFNPFVDNLLATCSEDCTVKISQIPDGGIVNGGSDVTDSLVTLTGHMKKVILFRHNPAANGVGLSASADLTCKLWDIQAQSESSNIQLPNTPYWIDWNQQGSQALITHKDKQFMVVDPRQAGAAASYAAFQGTKSSRVIYCEEAGLYFGCGFGRGSSRQYALWDPKMAGKALAQKDLDSSASVINPTWFGDNGVLFLVGKGDASVRYFELENAAPHLHFLSEFRDSKSQKGGGFKPKRCNNVAKCEIAHFLRLMPDMVMPVSFQVPRKSDLFQADIFPDAYAGVPSMESKEYFAGGTPPVPQRQSMKPGAAGVKKSGGGFTVQKTAAELLQENEQLKKKIASLEAELAKLKA
jgi:hypothetical protein